MTFCHHAAQAGISKRVIEMKDMTCTYYDTDDNKVLIEIISSVQFYLSSNIMKPTDIASYIDLLSHEDQRICRLLSDEITTQLTNSISKLRHGHPVWFLNDNPIV